jgi:hypothetical protein
MLREMFYIPYFLESIPGLIFVISILLFLFVSASAALSSISGCHLLLLSTYFNSYLSTVRNQQLIHSF